MTNATFTPDLLLAWARTTVADLGDARAEIDRLNVFPVPDGDTGTNMYLTMESALLALESMSDQPTTARDMEALVGVDEQRRRAYLSTRAMVRGALFGARGNSGVILSQILRGLLHAEPDDAAADWSGALFASALQKASLMAYEAVGHPVEGTILTVIRRAAEAAEEAAGAEADFVQTVRASAEAAHVALAETPLMLPALAEAGVVDSGGRGLTVLFDALLAVITGQRTPTRPLPQVEVPTEGHQVGPGYTGPAYEVMFLLEAGDEPIPAMRQTLDSLGDSLVVVGGEGLWNVHVHVDDAGAAVEAGLAAGRPFRIRITWLLGDDHAVERRGRGRRIVAVTHGSGVAKLLGESGVVTVPAQPRVSPSTGELLAAIEAAAAAEIVLLPSSKDIIPAAETAAKRARAHGTRVAVIPTRAIVQTLAAISVHDPDRSFDDDVASMSRASGAARYGAVTVASREAVTPAGTCQPGDVLGLIGGDIVLIGEDEWQVARAVVDRMLGADADLVTLVKGSDAADEDVEALAESIEDSGLEAVVVDGGQPLWPVIIGVE